MNNKLFAILLICTIAGTTSCRKVYHNCECAYLNEYDEADSMLISVRAKNERQASEECAKSEMRISEEKGIHLFCTLQR